MKRKLLAIILALAMMFALVGCTEEATKNNSDTVDNTNFARVGTGGDENTQMIVYVHVETRVMYAVFIGFYKGGMTVMLDADGKPLIWEGEL